MCFSMSSCYLPPNYKEKIHRHVKQHTNVLDVPAALSLTQTCVRDVAAPSPISSTASGTTTTPYLAQTQGVLTSTLSSPPPTPSAHHHLHPAHQRHPTSMDPQGK